jgi:hypothetical protein
VIVKNFTQMQLKPLEAIFKTQRFLGCLLCKDFLACILCQDFWFVFCVKTFGLSSMEIFLVCLLCTDFLFVFHVQIFCLSSM